MDEAKLATAQGRRRVEGLWSFTPRGMKYRGPRENSEHPYGIAISTRRFQSGFLRLSVRLKNNENAAGRILIGYNSRSKPYFTVGLGGHGAAYVVSEWVPGKHWITRQADGSALDLAPNRRYVLDVTVDGPRIALSVDSVPVLEYVSPSPVQLGNIGAYAWGSDEVRFGTLWFSRNPARAFVVMEFSEPFQDVYHKLIRVAASQAEIIAENVGEQLGPGNILDDISKGIADCALVIAEVSPPNANVFYEVGFAHALDKPTILIAKKGTTLPFDLKVHRCLFYETGADALSNSVPKLKRYIEAALKP
jgi:hypothetical protein